MNAGKIIAYIAAAILIFFGVLFMWGAGAETGGGASWVLIGPGNSRNRTGDYLLCCPQQT